MSRSTTAPLAFSLLVCDSVAGESLPSCKAQSERKIILLSSAARAFSAFALACVMAMATAPYAYADNSTDERLVAGSGAEDFQVNKDALLAAIDEAKGIADPSTYTDESQAALGAALKAAESVRDNSEASQAQADSATLTLAAAVSGLRERPFALPEFALPLLIAAAVLLVVAIVVVLALRRRRGGREKPRGPALRAADLPPVPQSQSTNQLAGSAPVTSGQLAFGDRQHQTQEYRQQFRSEAGSNHSLTIVLDEGGADGIAADVATNACPSDATATLWRLRTGESVRIGAAGATVGKDAAQATFVIGDNGTISRRHARIHVDNGRFYLNDLNATNGTYVNGQRLAADDAVPLTNGDMVTLSDEQFLFETVSNDSSK